MLIFRNIKKYAFESRFSMIYFELRFTLFNLNEFKITETELKLIAAAAIIGLSKIPKKGYSNPAANGIPKTL